MPAPESLRTAVGACRRVVHPLVSWARGGRGVRVRAGGWPIAVHPGGYADLRHWLRYEAATWAVVQRIWRPGLTVVDVGAHHGLFSLCFFRPGARPPRVIAIEPSAAARQQMERNRAIHPESDWTIVEAALGESEARLQMQEGWTGMLVPDAALHPGANGRAVEVPVTTLDRLCAQLAIKPDVIKIDVESQEGAVLAGGTNTLAGAPIVVLEWHLEMLRARQIDPWSTLTPLERAGYRFEPYDTSDSMPLTGEELRAWCAAQPERTLIHLLARAG